MACRVCKTEVNNTQCEKYAEKTLVLLGQVVIMACTKEIAKLQNRDLRFITRGERVGDDKASLRKRNAA